MARPRITTIKTLFALSCNVCAYPGCDQRMTDPSWNEVRADMAHIRGEKPGAARYDASMTDDERHDYANLLLLCPNHHRLIDRLDPSGSPHGHQGSARGALRFGRVGR
jgi:predicted restriction endonuclease